MLDPKRCKNLSAVMKRSGKCHSFSVAGAVRKESDIVHVWLRYRHPTGVNPGHTKEKP